MKHPQTKFDADTMTDSKVVRSKNVKICCSQWRSKGVGAQGPDQHHIFDKILFLKKVQKFQPFIIFKLDF